jgi:hypothetical protein
VASFFPQATRRRQKDVVEECMSIPVVFMGEILKGELLLALGGLADPVFVARLPLPLCVGAVVWVLLLGLCFLALGKGRTRPAVPAGAGNCNHHHS